MLDIAALDLSDLKTKGLQVVRDFFTPEEAADLAKRGDAVKAGVAAGKLTRSTQFALGMEDSWFNPLFRAPRLIDLVSGLIGPDLVVSTWRILMKDGHFNGPISVHQDWSYFGGDTRKINIFVPLTRVNRSNGAIVFYEGSHLYGPVDRGALDVDGHPHLTPSCPDLEIGDILIADFLTWHSSVPATNADERIMLQLVYQPSSDPSSKNLVSGRMLNPNYCLTRMDPLLEPLTQVTSTVAREHLAAGDAKKAERIARGALASDPDNAAAALLVHEILAAQKHPEADAFLERAQQAVARVNDRLTAQSPPAPATEAPPAPSRSFVARARRKLARILDSQ